MTVAASPLAPDVETEARAVLDLAVRLAREAGALQRDHYETDIEIRTKSTGIDLVTEIDHACEELIVGDIADEIRNGVTVPGTARREPRRNREDQDVGFHGRPSDGAVGIAWKTRSDRIWFPHRVEREISERLRSFPALRTPPLPKRHG